MEGFDQNGGGNGGSRWNPTKDQINMLEGLYKQGLRTPSAHQIQQITARLREFGHIEGKNVFYWFQNHKARQRQKQKQIKHDAFAYFHRYPPTPVFHNVVCSPCYSNGEPAAVMKRSRVVIPAPAAADDERYNKAMQEYYHYHHHPASASARRGNQKEKIHDQETLDLFPIHPTGVKHGIMIEATKSSPSSSVCDNDQTAPAPGKDNRFFEFFSCNN